MGTRTADKFVYFGPDMSLAGQKAILRPARRPEDVMALFEDASLGWPAFKWHTYPGKHFRNCAAVKKTRPRLIRAAYKGTDPKFIGKTALLQPHTDSGYVRAQFDDLSSQPYCLDWFTFPISDFLQVVDSATWTGRNHRWVFLIWRCKSWQDLTVQWIKTTDEDWPGYVRPTYGFGYGYDILYNLYGLRIYWKRKTYWLFKRTGLDDAERT